MLYAWATVVDAFTAAPVAGRANAKAALNIHAVSGTEDPRLTAYAQNQQQKLSGGARTNSENVALALLRACDGLKRGAAASPQEAAKVEAAVAAFEAALPCKLESDALLATLSGKWELIYSSGLVRRDGRRRDRFRNALADASSPQLGAVTQIFSGRRLEEEVELSLPAPFPLPRLEVVLVFEQSVEGVMFWPGKFTASNEELAIFRGGGDVGNRAVKLPSPRKVLDSILANAAQLLPLEMRLLKELEPRGGIGARREFTCTAALVKGSPRIRVLRSSSGEMQVFAWSGAAAAAATGGLGKVDGNVVSTAAVLAPVLEEEEASASTEPVGRVNDKGEPIEEFWKPADGFGTDWGV